MDLCEHINGYNLSLTYFPDFFDNNLKLKRSHELEVKINKRMKTLRHNNDIDYEDLLLGAKYIEYLGSSLDVFNDIRSIDVKALYLRYEDTLDHGSKKGDGYNYLFLLSVLKKPILEVLRSIDSRISCFPKDTKTKELIDFISRWNHFLSNDYQNYNYIFLNTFINELNEISRGDPILMGYNNIFDDALIQMNNNPHILKKKK